MTMSTSRLFSFLDNKHGFTVHFLAGQELMAELGKIHSIGPCALPFYTKMVLSSQQMITFLKPAENLGFYIDSEEPYFRFKIEMNNTGSVRTLLLPEEFEDFPEKFTGKVRLNKIIDKKTPYTSILEMDDHPVENLVNEVMEKSYQTKSKITVKTEASVSLMYTKLPPTNVNKKVEDFEDTPFDKYAEIQDELFQKLYKFGNSDVEFTVGLFEEHGFNYLGSKEVKFNCSCSHERMVANILTLPKQTCEEVFEKEDKIETRCDYCNTLYEINKSEVFKELH